MKLVPIAEENLEFVRLDLTRHYLQIDCDFTCFIVLNPSGNIPKGGTDICALHVGAWQIDAWRFLTKDFAQIPGFSACLVWDKTLVTGLFKAPQVAESDIDTANSISSLKGQPVNITGFSMAEGESLPVKTLDDVSLAVRQFSLDIPFNFLPSRFVVKLNEVVDTELLQRFALSVVDGVYKCPLINISTNKFTFIGLVWRLAGEYSFEITAKDDGYCSITVDDNNIVTSITYSFTAAVINKSVPITASGASYISSYSGNCSYVIFF